MKSQKKNDKRKPAKKKGFALLTGSEDFEREVSREEGLVLVSFLVENLNYASQLKVLEDAMEVFGRDFKFCLVDELSVETLAEKCRVGGTPTLIVFLKGREKARKLGHVDEGTLRTFLIGVLPDSSSTPGSKLEGYV